MGGGGTRKTGEMGMGGGVETPKKGLRKPKGRATLPRMGKGNGISKEI